MDDMELIILLLLARKDGAHGFGIKEELKAIAEVDGDCQPAFLKQIYAVLEKLRGQGIAFFEVDENKQGRGPTPKTHFLTAKGEL